MSVLNRNYMLENSNIHNTLYQNICSKLGILFEDINSVKTIEDIKSDVGKLVLSINSQNFKLTSFLSILNTKYYTHTHSLNVCVYAISLGKQMGLDKNMLEKLGLAALFHDIGKTKISDEILYKSGKLNNQEFLEVTKHPIFGWEILQTLGIKNESILKGVRNHHEKLDGTGYPDGQSGNNIHLFARVIGICDVFDALSTQKNHKDSYSTFDTLQLMKLEMKNHLDSSLINHLIMILKKEG